MCDGLTTQLAPGTTTMWFSPSSATAMSARPVSAPTFSTPCVSTPSSARTPRRCEPALSSPTMPTNAVEAPERAAATAWFRPLPPGTMTSSWPSTVCPGPGRRGTRATMSWLMLPTTVTSG
jgi:hypothetical protein